LKPGSVHEAEPVCWRSRRYARQHSPQQTIAAQVQAYVIFETGATSNAETVADKLRSTSLNNCLLIIVGRRARDVLVHVACDEQANSNYLGRAFAELSGVDGVARANLVLVKAGTE
jgi:hypothetical protein